MNTDLNKVLVLDPVVDVEESYRASEAVVKSGVNKSIYIYSADSYSNSNFIWNNIVAPSLSTVVKRDLRVRYGVSVAVVWTTATGGPNINAVNADGAPVGFNGLANGSTSYGIAPRAVPLQSSASAVELRLNGSSTSTSINDYACIYPHILDNDTLNRWSSEMPLMKDNSPAYQDPNGYYAGNVQLTGALPAGITGATLTAGYADNRNPLAPYGANTTCPTRGSYVWTQTLAPTVAGAFTYAIYRIELVEQLFISPMVWADMMDKSAGICNLNNLICNIRFQDVNRLISANLPAGCTLTVSLQSNYSLSVNGSIVSVASGIENPQLLVEYITQDPIMASRLPQTVSYDYSLVQPFITPVGNVSNTTTPNGFASLTAQSLRLASIPSKLFLYARPSKNYLATSSANAQTTPDNFLRITGIKINFNNRINLFATYTESDLYLMSVRNGLQDTFNDWRYNSGSVVIIDVAKDIGLESDECEGQANKYSTLQATITFNQAPLQYWGQATDVNYDFYILVEQPGKAFINASECQFILNGPSASEVLALTSNLDNKIDHTDLEGKGVGGSVFGKFGNLFKSGVNAFKNVNPEHVAKGMEMAQGALKSLGLGVAGGSTAGGAMRGKHSRVY